uniref:YCII-related domain protein n=1 Tax=Paecilomyces fulvus TaxID=89137 RepID=A0A172WCV8_9EURO|nr:YCII-related domain protein [Paecilomyces fulvus]
MACFTHRGIMRVPFSRRFSTSSIAAIANENKLEQLVSESVHLGELLVIIPDKPNVLERRIAIRPKHSPNFVRLHNEGYVSWAGPLFEKHVSGDVQRPFKGSAMVVNEQNREGFIQKIASDVYVKEGIWDLERAQVIPFRTTMRWQRTQTL